MTLMHRKKPPTATGVNEAREAGLWTEPMRYKYTCMNCKEVFLSPFKCPLCELCGSRKIVEE